MPDIVTNLACGTPHPDYGWLCQRIRKHDGDHLAADPYADTGGYAPIRRMTWRDPVAEEPSPALPGDPMGPLQLDEVAETVTLTPVTGQLDTGQESRNAAGALLLVSLLLLLWLLMPAIIVGVYRWAW